MARTVYEREDVIPMLADAFRELGYDGASMGRITEKTGLGKGSLYHFFPGGKEDMARSVLASIEGWFEANVFVPLAGTGSDDHGIAHMWQAVDTYFQSGQRVCLVGAFALDETRDRFADAVAGYFLRWIDCLAVALAARGHTDAQDRATQVVAGIQGALVLSRALNNPAVFTDTVRLLTRLTDAPP